MTIRKVRKGEPLSVSARDWNKIADAVNVFGNQSTPGSAQIGSEFVIVKNTLNRDLDRYAAVCIDSPVLIEPMTGKNDPVFRLLNPSLQSLLGRQSDPVVGILQEPIAQNRFGLAQISGVTPASFAWSENNTGGTNTSAPEFATISDDKDMLCFAQFGPVRVLQFNLAVTNGNMGTGKYIMVQLGQPATLGSVGLSYSLATSTWPTTPAAPAGWGGQGDFQRMGLHGDSENPSLGPLGKLYISRPGRYFVTVEWRFTLLESVTWNAGDRLEWRVNWPGPLAEYGGCHIAYWGSAGGVGTVSGSPVVIRGERVFYFNLPGAGGQEIPVPGIEAVRIPTTGSPSSISISPPLLAGFASIVRYGAPGNSTGQSGSWNSFWTKAKRDASWARGVNDGPI